MNEGSSRVKEWEGVCVCMQMNHPHLSAASLKASADRSGMGGFCADEAPRWPAIRRGEDSVARLALLSGARRLSWDCFNSPAPRIFFCGGGCCE